MILEIVLAMVEPGAGSVAHANREDVISSNGGILLGCFLAYVMTDYNLLSLKILSHCSKVASNMERMLQCGIVKSTRLLLQFLRETGTRRPVFFALLSMMVVVTISMLISPSFSSLSSRYLTTTLSPSHRPLYPPQYHPLYP